MATVLLPGLPEQVPQRQSEGGQMLWLLYGLIALVAAPLDDLRAIRQLRFPIHNWATPATELRVDNETLIELSRITGTVGSMATDTAWRVAIAVQVAGTAQSRRLPNTAPVMLSIVFRPWAWTANPFNPAIYTEFDGARADCAKFRTAIQAASYKPPVSCLVDAESCDCRAEPNRSRCRDLYAQYDALLRQEIGCTDVYWYSFGPTPAPAPAEFGRHAWAVPFPGMTNLGVELNVLNEMYCRRYASRIARAEASGLGIAKTAAWMAGPGSGKQLRWESGSNYIVWVFNAGPDTYIDAQMGRELFNPWHRRQTGRFLDPVDAICMYPSMLDVRLRANDPELKHLIAFLRGASD